MSPDLTCVVDRRTCEGITNTEVKVGESVAVIGILSHELLRSRKGIEVLGPTHYGFPDQYTPIEDLAKKIGESRTEMKDNICVP